MRPATAARAAEAPMVEAPAVTMPVGLEAVVLIPMSVCNVYRNRHVAA